MTASQNLITIKVDGDIASLKAAMAEAERSIKAALDAAPAGAGRTRAALDGVATDAGRAASGASAFTQALRDQIAVTGKSAEDVLRYRAAQAGVSAEAAPLILQLQNMRAALAAKAQEDAEAATAARAHSDALKQQKAAQDQFLASLRQQVDTQGMNPEALLRYRAAQLGVTQQADALISRLHAQGKAASVSAAQTRAAMAQLPMQMQDIVVSLAGGMNPLMVMLQQGPQITSSFGGIGNAARAMAGMITPARVALVGVGGALAFAGGAAIAGAMDMDRMTRSLALTGNMAGTSADGMRALAGEIASATGATAGLARESVEAAASFGNLGPQALRSVSTAIAAYAALAGKGADEVAEKFTGIAENATGWATKTNREMNFLTLATYQRIRALQEQGRAEEAAGVAAEAVAQAAAQRLAQTRGELSWIGRALEASRQGWSSFWEAAKGIDTVEGLDRALGSLEARLLQLPGVLGMAATALVGLRRATEAPMAAGEGPDAGDGLIRRTLAAQQREQNAQIAAMEFFRPSQSRVTQAPDSPEAIRARGAQRLAETRAQGAALVRAAGDDAQAITAAKRQAAAAEVEIQRQTNDELNGLANARSAQARANASAEIDRQVSAARIRAEAVLRVEERAAADLDALRDGQIVSATDYAERANAIDARRLAARVAAIQAEIAAENRRPIAAGDGAAAIGRRQRIAELQAQIAAAGDEVSAARLQREREAARQVETEAQQMFDRVNSQIDQARATNRQMEADARRTAASLIADPVARATAEARNDIAELERSADELRRALSLALVQANAIGSTDQARELAAQRDELDRRLADAIVMRNRQLARDLQPAWAQMLEGWRDTNRLMRESWDETFTGMINGADNALTNFFKTGKLNGGAILESLRDGIARNLSRQTLASFNVEGAGSVIQRATGFAGGQAMTEAWSAFGDSLKRGTLLQDAWNLLSQTSAATERATSATAAASIGALASAAQAAAFALNQVGMASAFSTQGNSYGVLGSLASSLFGGPGTTPAYTDGGGIFGSGSAVLPSVLRGGGATGTNELQRDMVTLVHKGEAIVPKAFNPWAGGKGMGGNVTVENRIEVINNMPGAQVRQQERPGPDGAIFTQLVIEQATRQAVATVSRQIGEGGDVGRAIEGRYGVRPTSMPRRG